MRYYLPFVVALATLSLGCEAATQQGPTEATTPDAEEGQAALQVTLSIAPADRAAAAEVFTRYRQPFLTQIDGATSKQLLLRDDDVQVLHHFDTTDQAQNYLESELFNDDVVVALAPLLSSPPEIRVYDQLPVLPIAPAAVGAYLEISLHIADADRPAAAAVYLEYRQPFLDTVVGALSKDLFIRDDDVQVLHGFASAADATAYLSTELFNNDVVVGLQPYLNADPEVRIYEVFPD